MTDSSGSIGRCVVARRAKSRRDSFLAVAAASFVLASSVLSIGACQSRSPATHSVSPAPGTSSAAAEITFVELGSVSCAPCKAMQPIMDAIEADYAGRVAVVFYDVNQNPNAASEYGIQMIPTQVFLDAGGKEFYRHVGFFPREEIDALLADHGVTPTGQ